MIPDLKTAAALALCWVFLGFAGGYKVADWRLTGQHTAEKLEAAQTAAKALADMTADRDRLSASLTTSNDQHLAELRKAQNETNHLRTDAVRLRVAATCPLQTAQTAGSTRVDSGTGAELNELARRAYFALRDGIDRATAQLTACQDELKLRAAQD